MPNCNRHNSASVMSVAMSMFIIQLLISTPILLVVLLWHSTWWSWSLLPYVYAQINGYCHYYYPECYIETHTSTYGTQGRFLETYTVWKKLAVLDFVALGILSTTWWFLHLAPIGFQKKYFYPEWPITCQNRVLSPWLCLLCLPCASCLVAHGANQIV